MKMSRSSSEGPGARSAPWPVAGALMLLAVTVPGACAKPPPVTGPTTLRAPLDGHFHTAADAVQGPLVIANPRVEIREEDGAWRFRMEVANPSAHAFDVELVLQVLDTRDIPVVSDTLRFPLESDDQRAVDHSLTPPPASVGAASHIEYWVQLTRGDLRSLRGRRDN